MRCATGVMGAGVAGEWVQLRYGSGGSGPLALYRDLVQRDELESGNFAQVCMRDGWFFCIFRFGCALILYVMLLVFFLLRGL